MNGPSCLCNSRWGAGVLIGVQGRWGETTPVLLQAGFWIRNIQRAWGGLEPLKTPSWKGEWETLRVKWTSRSWQERLVYQHGPCTSSHTCARGNLANSWPCPMTTGLAASNIGTGVMCGQLGLTLRRSRVVVRWRVSSMNDFGKARFSGGWGLPPWVAVGGVRRGRCAGPGTGWPLLLEHSIRGSCHLVPSGLYHQFRAFLSLWPFRFN